MWDKAVMSLIGCCHPHWWKYFDVRFLKQNKKMTEKWNLSCLDGSLDLLGKYIYRVHILQQKRKIGWSGPLASVVSLNIIDRAFGEDLLLVY